MYWQDLYQRLQISEVQYVLMDGHPPLALKLMAINTFFLFLFLIRRMKKTGPKQQIVTTLHWVLIFANLILLCQSNLAPYMSGLNRFF